MIRLWTTLLCLLFGWLPGSRCDLLDSRLPWHDVSLPVERRIQALMSQMTTNEKISQLSTNSGGIEHLEIPGFNWWSECLHGLWQPWNPSQTATYFPQPIGLAATWDPDFVLEVAGAISDEMRAVNNEVYSKDKTNSALNCFGPNINIFRDPRWGRGSETYGEDPHLTSQIAVHFVKGLQSNDPAYVKVAATCKHFAAYSLENADGYSRLSFNASVSHRDMVDTYLPAFEACVREANPLSIMCSYNAVNGFPTCASPRLLQQHLRQDWTFQGMVVSDCGAVEGVSRNHKFAKSDAEGAADTLKAGTDMSCADYSYLKDSLKEGLVNHIDIDMALLRVLRQRFKLGMFDPPEQQPWSNISADVVGSQRHQELAIEAVRKGAVLLKNRALGDGQMGLPLKASQLKKVSVLGPFAHSPEMLLGNYYGSAASHVTTPYEAIKAQLGEDVDVQLHEGTRVTGYAPNSEDIIGACRDADACIFFVGSSMIAVHEQEDPQGQYSMWSGTTEGEGFDRTHLRLPGSQEELIKAAAVNTDAAIIVVLIHGGPLDVSWLEQSDRVDAILSAWHPGQGAAGIADILFGKVSPSGKLPVTFYYDNYTSLIDMSNMDMRVWPGRTYRYLKEPALYEFSHGLSYTTFEYRSLALFAAGNSSKDSNSMIVQVEVHNTGLVEADEVVQLFVAPSELLLASTPAEALPCKALKGFARVSVKPSGHAVVQLPLSSPDFQYAASIEDDARNVAGVVAGDWLIQIGSEEALLSVISSPFAYAGSGLALPRPVEDRLSQS